MKDRRGITLVSLVVTIIVLIILAGVSINLTLGENGIITMAKRARENMELAKVDEQRQLNELYDQIVTEGGSLGNASDDAIIRLAQFKKEIASAITDMGIETAENADASTMSSNIRNLSGASSANKVSYDNTNSGLTATNVQGAVDEVDSKIDELNDSLIYKLEETVIGKWINGKPLYRKGYAVTCPNTTTNQYPLNIDNLETVTKLYGMTQNYPLPYIATNAENESKHSIMLWLSTNDRNICLRTATNRSDQSGYVWIEYTKTTD